MKVKINLNKPAQLLAVIFWLAGLVIANGFWSTFFALFIPLWAWYLVVEAIIMKSGLL